MTTSFCALSRRVAVSVVAALFVMTGGNCCAREVDSGQKAHDLQQRVQEMAEDFLRKHELVGLSIGIIDGAASFTVNLGEVKTGSGMEPTSATLYEIGSITKTFTAVELARQVLQGRLRLQDPVERWLPEGQRVPEYSGEPIRLIHLATHTSGLPRIPTFMVFSLMMPGVASNPYKDYDGDYLYDYLSSATIWRKPGEKYDYSNLGAGLLGFTLARVYGSSYETMITETICAPLGMYDTVITITEEQMPRLAFGHVVVDDAPQETQNWDFEDAYAGAGGLKSTVRDMTHYMAANLGLTTGPIAQACAFTHETQFADGSTTVGLAWHKITDREQGELLIHDGGTGGYSSVVVLNVRRQAGVVVLSNKFNPTIGRLGRDLLKVVEREN